MTVEATRFEVDNAPIHQDTISVVQGGPEQEIADHDLQEILYTAAGELGIATRTAATNRQLINQEIATAEERAEKRAVAANTAADEAHETQVTTSTKIFERFDLAVKADQLVVREDARDERSVARRAYAEQIRQINEAHKQNMRRIAFAENRKLDLTKLWLIDARLKHEAEIDQSDSELKARKAAIEATRKDKLQRLKAERESNTEFYDKCEKVIATIIKGVDIHHIAHDEATRAIMAGLDGLARAQAQIIETQEILQERTLEYDELIREYDAHEQAIAQLRKTVLELMRTKNDKKDELYKNRRALEAISPQTADGINDAAATPLEDDQYAFHSDQVATLETVASVEEEIAQLKGENQRRNQKINALRNHMNACEGVIAQLQTDQALYEEEIANQQAKRDELTPSALALEDKIDILHKLQRKEYDTFESVPLEFRALAQAALNTEVAKPADEARIPDFATSIPGFDQPVLHISITPEEMPIFYMEGRKPVSLEDQARDAEVRYSSFLDIVEDANTQFNHAKEWFREHVGSGLVEAAHILPQGLLSRGMTVRIKGQDK